MTERPRRQVKTKALDDFIDDKSLDEELHAIESAAAEISAARPSPIEGGARKRGRPRKYPPPAAPPPQAIKRPRGRPKGSGKHQRAAAAAATGVGFNGGSPGAPADSAITSGAVSAAPSSNPNGDVSASTPHMAAAMMIARENGAHTPHYPPQQDAPSTADSTDAPPATNGLPLPRPQRHPPTLVHGIVLDANKALLAAETPTPRPRNRRKVAVPTKTE